MKLELKRILFYALLFYVVCFVIKLPPIGAQQGQSGRPWETLFGTSPSIIAVPATSTAITTLPFARVNEINLHNVTGVNHTVYITDGSLACNNGPCPIIATTGSTGIVVNAGSTYAIALGGQPANGGIYWKADIANSVMGWVSGVN